MVVRPQHTTQARHTWRISLISPGLPLIVHVSISFSCVGLFSYCSPNGKSLFDRGTVVPCDRTMPVLGEPDKLTTPLLSHPPSHNHYHSTPPTPSPSVFRAGTPRNFSYPTSVSQALRPATPPSPLKKVTPTSWDSLPDQLTPLSIHARAENTVRAGAIRPYDG